jgi:hypothetical protein
MCSHNCASHIRESVDGDTVIWFNASLERSDPEFHPDRIKMYIDPSCRRQAGKMFLGRKFYMAQFLGTKKIPPGCPECLKCGSKDKDPDGLTRRALGHTC